jgi:branched-subunit amino acid aminotransferase/4-amino-4-deoxychorismate lyase
MKIFIDGKFLEQKNAKVSVFDHGLLFGDGVFEGVRADNGRIFRLREHIDRDECFLTGTGAELIPGVKIHGPTIGNGKPGPCTCPLTEKYHALTKVSGEPIYDE